MNGIDPVQGCRVLVVEDDMLLSLVLQDLLTDMGCTVAGSAARLDEAQRQCGSVAFDVALLDVNLHGQQTFAIAQALRQRNLPFVITTGYGERILPETLCDTIVLQKPYRREALEAALRQVLGGSATSNPDALA